MPGSDPVGTVIHSPALQPSCVRSPLVTVTELAVPRATDDRRRLLESFSPPLIAAVLAALAAVADFKGVDLPAALYRVSLFHRHGLTLWDSHWYGGHWTLDYSVIFAPVAGILGIHLTEIACVAVAALAFDRLAVGALGRSARVGSIVFALGTLVQVAIGQVPFLLGEALGLVAIWALSRGRWRLAILLAAATALATPLAGAFLALAATAWLIADWPRRRAGLLGVMVAVAIPVIAMSLLFPGQGAMPFPFAVWFYSLIVFVAAALCVPARLRALRIGAWLYVGAVIACYFIQTPIGGNVERLGQAFGPALLVLCLWPDWVALLTPDQVPPAASASAVGVLTERRASVLTTRGRVAAATLVLILLSVMQWEAAIAPIFTNRYDQSVKQSYFTPLLAWMRGHSLPAGRIEIVPTRLHWEAAYAAPTLTLARGWERQLDTANNPIFYERQALTPTSYRAWLLDNGVRYVALPDTRLDYAATKEGALLEAGVPGLREVWKDAHWRVFAVQGAPGIVSGDGVAAHLGNNHIDLEMKRAGVAHLSVRYSTRWIVATGPACTAQDPGGWLRVESTAAGRVRLALRFDGSSADPCPTSTDAAAGFVRTARP